MHILEEDEDDCEVQQLVNSTAATNLRTETPTSLTSSGYGNSLNSQTTSNQDLLTASSITPNSSLSNNESGDEELIAPKEDNNSIIKTNSTKAIPEWLVLGESVRTSPDSKTGVVAFIGETEFAPGLWVGVILDTPTGKNDGSVDGVSYFDCRPKFGIFVNPNKLKPDPRGRAMRQATSTNNNNNNNSATNLKVNGKK